MTPATSAWIAATSPPVICEHALDRTLVLQAKTAIRRLAAEQSIDLGHERVSLWRPRGPQDFEHLASTRSVYQAVPLAETFAEDLFLFDAPAGDVLTLVAASTGEGE
jgi:hypothetical protein